MPKLAKALSALEVKRLTHPGLHAVGTVAGLRLLVKESGARSWVLRTSIGNRRAELGLGGYPTVSLAQAIDYAREALQQIRSGIDPAAERRAKRQTVEWTFERTALAYIEAHRAGWKNDKHAAQWENTLRTYAFPLIGNMSIESIKTSHILEILSPIWGTKNETATRVRGRLEKILSASITSGHRESSNPALWRGHLENLLPKIRRLQDHHSALPYQELPDFMVRLRSVKGMSSLAL